MKPLQLRRRAPGSGIARFACICALGIASATTSAQDAASLEAPEETVDPLLELAGTSGKLLLTGGVTQVEGAAGGGLTPWAVIGGYGTSDQIGGNAYYTRVALDDYRIDSYGALIGFHDRAELSVSRLDFDTEQVGALLGLGRGFTITQDTLGVKVKLFGDAVLEQDTWLPQVSAGIQYKRNKEGALLRAIGAQDDSGIDFYLSATKLYLNHNLMLNATLRFTEANQFGVLGFGGDKDDGYSAQLEASAAYLINRRLAIGAEYRTKPDNLAIATEDDAWDLFIAWAPYKNVSVTLAYVDLGNIVLRDDQGGIYASVQVGF